MPSVEYFAIEQISIISMAKAFDSLQQLELVSVLESDQQDFVNRDIKWLADFNVGKT